MSVFDGLKTYDDYQRAEQEFQLKKQLAAAQLAKANEFDIDKVGQQAFIKASQGMPLSPVEASSLQYLDSKQQTMAFNPVTGAMEQKPSLLGRAGIGSPAAQPVAPVVSTAPRAPAGTMTQGQQTENLTALGYEPAPDAPTANQWDQAFQQQMTAAVGNPKLQQTIRENYAKSKINMNESESKAATFADRMALAEPILSDPVKVEAYASPTQRALNKLTPFTSVFGNYLNNGDYNSFDAAQKNFETAKLRQESGATIHEGEFKTDEQILLPRATDTAEMRAEKKANRDAILRGMQRQAGPAYVPTEVKPVTKPTVNSPPTVTTRAQYDAIPSGSVYTDRNGNQATKR